ncbi:MAG: bifunctional precorrin-2 dehydrogenase/sirohydrochlorin ferrochelatase [Candidatus Bathyarchaeia archaeon]
MIVDMNLKGKKTLVVGGTKVAERRVRQLLESGSSVTVASNHATAGLKRLSEKGMITLRIGPLKPFAIMKLPAFISAWSVLAMSGDRKVDRPIIRAARRVKKLSAAMDDPEVSDMSFPAVARLGSARVTISTGGKSPAMASLLRRKIETVITKRDLRQIELQAFARKIARTNLSSSSERKTLVYRLIQNRRINTLLAQGKLREAKNLAASILSRTATR